MKKQKKNNFKFFLKTADFKAANLVAVFILIANLIAIQSGITDFLSDLMVSRQTGEVAGEQVVRMAQVASPRLGISGDMFTLNGQETFLLGTSIFDAVGKLQESDLEYLSDNNYNLIRVWLYWRDQNVAYDEQGNLTADKEEQLQNLVEMAGRHGIVVDVTLLFLYEGGSYPSFGTDQSKMVRAVGSVTNALIDYDNVLFDVMNEHDHEANVNISHQAVQNLINEIKAIDNDRIVTVSSTGRHIVNDMSITNENMVNIEAEAAMVDVLTPHFYRNSGWYDFTDNRVNLLEERLRQIGRDIPIYLQEENYYNHPGSSYTDGDTDLNHFVTAATLARSAGAAGWNFHHVLGFDLDSQSFYEALGASGRQALETIGAAFGTDLGPQIPNQCQEVTDSLSGQSLYGEVNGGNFSAQGWSPTGAQDYLEYRLCQSVPRGYLEFTVTNVNPENLDERVYNLAAVLDKATIYANNNEPSQNPNRAMLNVFGYNSWPAERRQELAGQLHFRSNIDNQTGCSDDSDSATDECPQAWERWSRLFAFGDWDSSPRRFRIEWGAGSNNGHLIYSYLPTSGAPQVLIDWNYGQVTNFSWDQNSLVARFGATSSYRAVSGAIYSDIVLRTGGLNDESDEPEDPEDPDGPDDPGGAIIIPIAEPTDVSQPLKIAENARDPSIAISQDGRMHIVYDTNCSLKDNDPQQPVVCDVMYVVGRCDSNINNDLKIRLSTARQIGVGRNSRVATDSQNQAHVVWEDAMGFGGSGRDAIRYNLIRNGEPVFGVNGQVVYRQSHAVEKPRIAVTSNDQVYIYFQVFPHVAYVSFNGGQNISEFSQDDLIIIDNVADNDQKGVRMGGVAVDYQDGVNFTFSWRPNDRQQAGIYHRRLHNSSLSALTRVTCNDWGASDFVGIFTSPNNSQMSIVGEVGWTHGGQLYNWLGTVDNVTGCADEPSFGPLIENIGIIDNPDNINTETYLDETGINYVTLVGCRTENVCENHAAYFYTRTNNSYSNLEKIAPSLSGDQGYKKRNPLAAPAWNQGVFVVFENQAANRLYDVYLVGVGGAQLCRPFFGPDFNCDGRVDIQDFGILLSHWLKTGNSLENYRHPGCVNEEVPQRNLNLHQLSGNEKKIDISDFGVLFSCWTSAGRNIPEACYRQASQDML